MMKIESGGIKQDLLVLFVLTSLFYVMDVFTEKNKYTQCRDTIKMHLLLFFHHFVNTFVMFGWMSQNRILLSIFLIFPFIVALHWRLNDNKCIMTTTLNKNCGKKEDEYFHDILYLSGIKHSRFYPAVHYVLLFVVWTIGLYRMIINK